MNKLLILFGGLMCLSCLTLGCLDKIEFERPETIKNGLAIQGKLVKGTPSFIRVSIKRLLDFASAPRAVNARSVTLFDELGNSIALESRAEGFFFKTIPVDDPTIKVDFGKTYKIKVETFDDRTFESAMEGILPAPEPTALKVKRIQKESVNANGDLVFRDNYVEFTIDTPLEVSPNSGNSNLVWELEGVYQLSDTPELHGRIQCAGVRIAEENKTCYLSFAPSNNFIPLGGKNLGVNAISDYVVFESVISPTFSEGYYLNVFQQSVTDEAFEYWSQAHKVNSLTGGLFEAPAGKIKSNIVNLTNPEAETFGYFYATEEKVIRVFVSPELAGNPNRFCPSKLNPIGQVLSANCCDCLISRNTTVEKPSWW